MRKWTQQIRRVSGIALLPALALWAAMPWQCPDGSLCVTKSGDSAPSCHMDAGSAQPKAVASSCCASVPSSPQSAGGDLRDCAPSHEDCLVQLGTVEHQQLAASVPLRVDFTPVAPEQDFLPPAVPVSLIGVADIRSRGPPCVFS